jgi:tetratricopeptide (TPR) repeat protein
LAHDSAISAKIPERGVTGFRMHKLKQEELINFMKKYPDLCISPKEIYLVLFEILSKLFPSVNKNYGSNWLRAKYFYFHTKKMLKNYRSVLDRESDSIAFLYSRVADFNKHILGKYKEAKESAEKALALNPNDPHAKKHISEAEAKLKK